MIELLTGADFDNDAAFERAFGEPPKVIFEVVGEPPDGILVRPASTWLRTQKRPAARRQKRT